MDSHNFYSRKIDSFFCLHRQLPNKLPHLQNMLTTQSVNICIACLCSILLVSSIAHFYSFQQSQNNHAMQIYGSYVEKTTYNNETIFITECLAKNDYKMCQITIGTFTRQEVANVMARKICTKNEIVVVNNNCEKDVKYEWMMSITENLFFVAVIFGIVAFVDFCAWWLKDAE